MLTERREALEMFAASLQRRFPGAVSIFLYGSEARKEADVDSDLDVLLVVQPELRRSVRGEAAQIVSRLTSNGAPHISVVTVDQAHWQRSTPFNNQIRRDAIAL